MSKYNILPSAPDRGTDVAQDSGPIINCIKSPIIIDDSDSEIPEYEWPEPDTENCEGAPAYDYTDKLNLVTRVLTTFMGEEKYYESGEQGDGEILRLFDKIVGEDPEFAKGLVLAARKEYHLRSVSHVLAAELAQRRIPEAADLIAEICERPDDMTEILAYFQTKYKDKPIPNSIKKGLAKAFATFNEYQLSKYDKKGKVWLRDILRIAHPKAANEEQNKLWKKVTTDTLPPAETWENKISTEGSTQANWEAMIDSEKMGYMATLRNLRNFLDKGVSMAHIVKVAKTLRDPEEVKKSKQLPFRFFSAYRMLSKNGQRPDENQDWNQTWGENETKEVLTPEEESARDCKVEVLCDALEEAARLSSKNLPELKGTTTIACDTSGSMSVPVSAKSTIQNVDIGFILGALANGFTEKSITGMFADTWKEVELDPEKPLASALGMNQRSGEVGHSTNGYEVIKSLLETRRKVDRIMFFTDCQLYGGDTINFGDRRDIGNFIRQYRKEINKDLKLYFFDLAGYGQCVVPESDPNTLIVGGWSEKLFDLIPAFESGNFNQSLVDKIGARYQEWKAKKKK